MTEDLVLRFSWTASVTVQLYSFIDSAILTTILASLEVFRSFINSLYDLSVNFVCVESKA